MLLAVALHAVLFLAFFNRQPDDTGAEGKGMQGVVINLGMLGDLGEKKVSKKAKKIAKPKPKVKTKPKPKRAIKKLKPKPKPVKKTVEPKQATELLVKKTVVEPVKKEIKAAVTPDIQPLPVTAVVDEVSEPAQESNVLAGTETNAEQTGKDTVAMRQKTTGLASDADAGGAQVAARTSYSGLVAAKFKKQKRYPRFSRRRHEEGVVKLSFKLDRNGNVLSSEIVTSSGYARLDKEVLRMLKKAQPFPIFPSEMTQETLRLTIPVSFALN